MTPRVRDLDNPTPDVGFTDTPTTPTSQDHGLNLPPLTVTDPNMFVPLDTTRWFTGKWEPPSRIGSGDILLEGHLNWLDGESGSAKTWFAAVWALDHLRAGRKVGWVDEEMGEAGLRLRMLGVGAGLVDLANFDALEPMSRDLATHVAAFHEWAASLGRGGLLVLDSAAPILAASGVEENSNGEVTQFMGSVLLPLSRRYGLTVLVIDHKSKEGANGSKYSRGAGSKRNAADAYFTVRPITPLSKEQDGQYELAFVKDRGAKYVDGDVFDVVAKRTGAPSGGRVEWSFTRLDAAERERRKVAKVEDTADAIVERVVALLAGIYPQGMSASAIKTELSVRDATAKAALVQAQKAGRIAQDGETIGGTPSWRAVETTPTTDATEVEQ